MCHISKLLEHAVATMAEMSEEQQSLIAFEMMERARMLSGPPASLTAVERASAGAVSAMYAKYGL